MIKSKSMIDKPVVYLQPRPVPVWERSKKKLLLLAYLRHGGMREIKKTGNENINRYELIIPHFWLITHLKRK